MNRAWFSGGCLGIAAALHQRLEHKSVLINGAPWPMILGSDRNDDLVEMPFIAEPAARTLTDLAGEGASECLCPKPDRLMRNDDPSRRQHVLDHPQADGKPEIQPHGMGNDFSGEAMPLQELRMVDFSSIAFEADPAGRRVYASLPDR